MSETTEVPPATPPAPTRADVVHQISKALQDRRAVRALTLEKVSQMIKIRLPYLQALEKGEWNELPGEVYVRGFLKRYAQFLGLDADKLIAPYLSLSEPIVQKNEPKSEPSTSEFGRTQLIWIVLGAVFIIGFLKVIKQDRSVTPVKRTPPAVTQPEGQQPAVNTNNPIHPQEPKPVFEKHVIEIFSPFPLWLRVSASDKNFEGFIPQASTWTWKGEGECIVRLGHTKQVSLYFDGKLIPIEEDQKKITLPLNEN